MTTIAASGISMSGATSGGEICHDGGATVTARGVCYGENPTPDITGPKTTDGSGTGTFVSTLSGLMAGTTYYVRAYATNGVGTSYGQEITFMTVIPPSFPNICNSSNPTIIVDVTNAVTGKTWMDRNLGATGLLPAPQTINPTDLCFNGAVMQMVTSV